MRLANTRRTFLKVVTAVGGASAIGVAGAQENDDPDIELGGRTAGWEGVTPEEIEDETNPTLELVDGEEYVLEWENLDGEGHNFVIEDADGDDVVETDYITSGSQTVEFTASEEMVEYYCEPHPQSMRGEIEIVEDDEDEEVNDEEDVEEFAAPVDELFELRLDEDGWHGEHPEEIEDETDPALSVLPGEAYVISFTNDFADMADDEEMDNDVAEDDEMEENEEMDNGVAEDGEVDENGEMDNDVAEDDDADPDADEEVIHEEGSNLELLDEDGEEIVSTELLDPGQRGAIAFVATEEMAAYHDDSSGAEGEIEIAEDPVDEDDE